MESRSDHLLLNLVHDADSSHSQEGKVSFISAMHQLGIESVFDIIRQSKTQFIERLAEICEADGSLAYDNAMCYAGQIASLYREQRVSNGHTQHLSQRSGVHALVDVGPSYPNQFKENWDQFCKVGALAALDSPVAYLNSLYHFATRTLETSGQGTQPKIKLSTRRPDIAGLVIDQHSTFTPRPMLELVNDLLKTDIQRYLQGTPDKNRSIYHVLAERRHPFQFPYSFAHHQCQLGLTAKKFELGGINYRISMTLPLTQERYSNFGTLSSTSAESQKLLSGLSPQQQKLLTEPSLFSTFYLSKAELAGGKHWRGPSTSHLRPHSALGVGFVVPSPQLSVLNVEPYADRLINLISTANRATVRFSLPDQATLDFNAVEFRGFTPVNTTYWRLNHLHSATFQTLCPSVRWTPTVLFPTESGYRSSFEIVTTTGTLASPISLAKLSFTLILDDVVTWTAPQQAFFESSYGLPSEALIDLKYFMQQTGVNAEQVEALLSLRTQIPRLSPNCPSKNPQSPSTGIGAPYPHASHYGACYVNGHGSDCYDSVVPATTVSIRKDQFDNSMGLREVKQENRTAWYLTKTSANRFDRLQRMIRLQRWLDIPFAELDTLIISTIRSEGEDNLTMDLNTNTLRALGVYRYLSQRYNIQPEEFSAFLHDITPYATGDRVPLFDQVFNRSALFGTPLVLDQVPFDVLGADPPSKKTVSQLCAGLGLQPSETSFLRLVRQTFAYVGTLKLDLATVSSLYRQARLFQMFGLSVEEGVGLVDLLGGEYFQRLLCTGRVSVQTPQKITTLQLSATSVNGELEINLRLVADASQATDELHLLPGSMLQVVTGDYFETATTSNPFSLIRMPEFGDLVGFLTNADGGPLILEPVSQGESIPLSGCRISLAGWDALTDAATVKHLLVRRGTATAQALTITKTTVGDSHGSMQDVLDVLMQMDWAVNWLKDSKQNVSQVRQLLGLDRGDYLPPEGLTDRLAPLLEDTQAALVTDQQLLELNLPTHEQARKAAAMPGAVIDWRLVLMPLLDQQGLVKTLPLQIVENTQGQLLGALGQVLAPLKLAPEVKAQCLDKLGGLLLAGHDKQLRVIEGLAQEMANLPMDRTLVVVRWAGTTVYDFLSTVLSEVGLSRQAAPKAASLIGQLQSVLRHAQAALHLRLSTSALRLFLVKPDWLKDWASSALSLENFYLLGRYSQWFDGQSQAEEALLGYFISSNRSQPKRESKARQTVFNGEMAEVLATLLGWRQEEVFRLFKYLPKGRACSMAEVDWVRRCHLVCSESGLAAADVLAVTGLYAGSSMASWEAVGEAVMAASRFRAPLTAEG